MKLIGHINNSPVYRFTDEEIAEAKTVREKKDGVHENHRVLTGNRYSGRLSQMAIQDFFYPVLEMVGVDDNFELFDFHSKTYKYDAKCKNGNYEYSEDWQFDINEQQFLGNDCDIYIGCYHQLGTPDIVIVGWMWKSDVQTLGNYLEKGSMFKQQYKVKESRYDIDFKHMYDIRKLPI